MLGRLRDVARRLLLRLAVKSQVTRAPILKVWDRDDDAALESILGLRAYWESRHRGHPWLLDTWGEGPSLVTLGDLGFDARLRMFILSAVCPVHGRFNGEWSGGEDDERPRFVRCAALSDPEARCEMPCRVDFSWEARQNRSAA